MQLNPEVYRAAAARREQTHPQTQAMNAIMSGTRSDLAAFLRKHRRQLCLKFFDRYNPDVPTHIFWASVPVFDGQHFFDFQIFPF